MVSIVGNLELAGRWIHRHRGLILPIAAAALIFAVLVPLPPALMDVLLAGNIALAAVILLTTIYVSSPLEFSVFPSLLLGATLIRLVLNVATTRLILTAGADGRTMEQAQLASGKVIWAFSHFVTAGSLEVGVILFTIIAIIQFVVVTKGAARVSEVAARFVLDAMPGKQMAIDADLNAALIDETEAHRRRERIAREADFYGAMDGASKFLRGDAMAAVIITMVNILGGLYVGLVQYGWSLPQTLGLFTRLTIGDGLVTQIPAFLVSISAALIVTRSTGRSNLGEDIVNQLTGRPIALVITAVFLGALALTELPKIPLLLLGAGCASLAWVLSRRQNAGQAEQDVAQSDGSLSNPPQSIEPLLRVDPLGVELGLALARLANPDRGADLLERLAVLREQIASELGLIVPHVRISDEMHLGSETYVVKIRGLKVGSGQLHHRKLLAISDGEVAGEIQGIEVREAVFSSPAVWISRSQRDEAERLNYTLVEPTDVLVTHLGEIIRRHADKLLTRQQVTKLLENLKTEAPSVVEEAMKTFSVGQIQKLLQGLLRERVAIRDLETLLEAMCDGAGETGNRSDIGELTESVRRSLGAAL
ncbi:MAG: flagellar biosynthesis protein FlhA, partial [Planctomycetota bacterium]